VIDVRDNAKIAGQLDRHEGAHYAGARKDGQLTGAPATSTAPARTPAHAR
jgi:hypothetical protein